jgi:hypothetical protein
VGTAVRLRKGGDELLHIPTLHHLVQQKTKMILAQQIARVSR